MAVLLSELTPLARSASLPSGSRPHLPTMMWSCTATPSGEAMPMTAFVIWISAREGHCSQLILSPGRFHITDFCQPMEAFLTRLPATPASDWIAPPYMLAESRRGPRAYRFDGLSVRQLSRAAFGAASNKKISEERAGRAITKSLASGFLTMSRSSVALISFLLMCKRGIPRRIVPSVHRWNA